MSTPGFEQGPIRPPSEAHSLLVRVVRNCAWNRCSFCPVYKGTPASRREVPEVLADLDAMAAAAETLGGGHAPADAMMRVLESGVVPREAMQVALFLRDGARHAFLQDADPCIVRPERLVMVLARLRERFPTVRRVTTYGRAATLARRRPEDVRELADQGLTRLHMGLESGADEVLAQVCKGATSEQSIAAGRNVLAAGMELCYYVMPGLGGRRSSAVHVAGTAAVIRAVAAAAGPQRPLVVRLRTVAVPPGTPLAEMERAGDFELPDDVEIALELRELLEQVGEARFELSSDHSLNMLMELAGSLPDDRPRLLGVLDRYLSLPAREQAEFALGARLGVFRRLADLDDPRRRGVLWSRLGLTTAGAAEGAEVRDMLAAARDLRSRFI